MVQNDSKKADVPNLISALLKLGVNSSKYETLLMLKLDKLIKSKRFPYLESEASLQKSLNDRMLHLEDLIRACDALEDAETVRCLADFVRSSPGLYPPLELCTLMNTNCRMVYHALRDYLIDELKLQMNQALRSPDDFSLNVPKFCTCKECKPVRTFLESKTETKLILSVIQHTRKHILGALANHLFPIDAYEMRQGSPHKLVIEKHKNIYDLAKQRYDHVRERYNQIS